MDGQEYMADKMGSLISGGEDEFAPSETVEDSGVETTEGETHYEGGEVEGEYSTKGESTGGDQAPDNSLRDEIEGLKKQNANAHYLLRQNQRQQAERDRLAQVPNPGRAPDWKEDPQGYEEWQGRAQQSQQYDQQLQNQSNQQQIQQVQQAFVQSAEAFKQSHEEYDDVISQARTLRIQGYADLNYDPATATKMVEQEMAGFILQNLEQGLDPAQEMFNFAMQGLTSAGYELYDAEYDADGNEITGVAPPPNQYPAAANPSTVMPSLSQIASLGSSHAPGGGAGVISAEQFYEQVPATNRLAIEHQFPSFMEAMRLHGAARVPEKLQGMLSRQV